MYKDKKAETPAWKRGLLGQPKTYIALLIIIGAVIYLVASRSTLDYEMDELEEMIDENDDSIHILSDDDAPSVAVDFLKRQTICNPRQILCERRRDPLFDGLHRIDAQELVHRVMTKSEFKCNDVETMGTAPMYICMDRKFRPTENDCLVYSFGVHDDYSFEDDISENYGCEIHIFDPSRSKSEHANKPNVFFHDAGIWGDNYDNENGWKLRRLSTITDMLGHRNRVIDIVKMNAFGAEWPLFRDMALDASPLDNIKQFLFKAHSPRRKHKNQPLRMTDYAQLFRAISMLKRIGFRNFHSRDDESSGSCCKFWIDMTPAKIHGRPGPICCYELFLVNLNHL